MKIETINTLTDKPKYNWRKIWKEYNKLPIPNDVWKPQNINMNNQAYILNISERATGKTTQWLLLALKMNQMYGTTFGYIRQYQNMITPKHCGKIFDTIRNNGYIELLTNGKYKDVYLWGGVFRYCNRDEKTQKVIEESEPIGYTFSVDNSEIYKSNFNNNTCDIVIFDEFISSKYMENEFQKFVDILSTIGRQRAEFYIIMLGNTLNIYNKYLQELGITRDLRTLHFGDKKVITSGVVKIYIELISMNEQHKTTSGQLKQKITMFRFGFNNTELNSVIGGDWNIKQYPHTPSFVEPKKDKKVGMFLVSLPTDTIKATMYIHHTTQYILFTPYTGEYKGDIIRYTLEQPTQPNERYGLGYNKADRIIWNHIVNTDKVYFSVNECGLILEEYLKRCNTETFI